MKKLLLGSLLLFLCFVSKAQNEPSKADQMKMKMMLLHQLQKIHREDSLKKYYAESEHAEGTGSGTFSVRIKTLQKYFTTKRTIKQFESTLGKWEREPFEYLDGGSSPEYAYVIDGRNTQSDLIRATYTSTLKDGQSFEVIVEFGLDQIIRTITFHITEDVPGTYADHLRNEGYYYDAYNTKIGTHYVDAPVIYAKNSANKVAVRIFPGEAGTLITVMKSRT